MIRTEMRRCGKQYASEWAARNSKGWEPGMAAVLCADSRCGCWHLRKAPAPQNPIARSTEPKVKVPAPRAAPGHMRAAVSMVLAQERSIADAAREFSVDAGRLWDAAWAAAKDVVHDRDSETCAACGKRGVDVHHRYRRGTGGTADTGISLAFTNLTLLCREDHAACHDKDPELYERRFWLTREQDPAEFPVFALTEYGIEARWLLANGKYELTGPREAAK